MHFAVGSPYPQLGKASCAAVPCCLPECPRRRRQNASCGAIAEEFGIAGSGVWSWHAAEIRAISRALSRFEASSSCLLVPTGTVLKDVFGVGLLRGPRRGVDQRANFYSKPPRHVDATPQGARNRSSPCRGLVFCIYISASRAGSDETSGVGRWISSDRLPR